MNNPLRAIHVAPDGSVRVHFPEPLSRLVTAVKVTKRGHTTEYTSPVPVPLYNLIGTTNLGAAVEIIAGETDLEHVTRTAAKSTASITAKGFTEASRQIVDASALPVISGEAAFREAWRFVGGSVVVDLAKAREIVMDRARELRDQKLIKSDSEKNRLDDVGNGQQKQELAAYRQKLRDLPTTVATEIGTMTLLQLHRYRPTMPTANFLTRAKGQ